MHSTTAIHPSLDTHAAFIAGGSVSNRHPFLIFSLSNTPDWAGPFLLTINRDHYEPKQMHMFLFGKSMQFPQNHRIVIHLMPAPASMRRFTIPLLMAGHPPCRTTPPKQGLTGLINPWFAKNKAGYFSFFFFFWGVSWGVIGFSQP